MVYSEAPGNPARVAIVTGGTRGWDWPFLQRWLVSVCEF